MNTAWLKAHWEYVAGAALLAVGAWLYLRQGTGVTNAATTLGPSPQEVQAAYSLEGSQAQDVAAETAAYYNAVAQSLQAYFGAQPQIIAAQNAPAVAAAQAQAEAALAGIEATAAETVATNQANAQASLAATQANAQIGAARTQATYGFLGTLAQDLPSIIGAFHAGGLTPSGGGAAPSLGPGFVPSIVTGPLPTEPADTSGLVLAA